MSEGLGPLRVLIVDDNAQMRTIIGTILGGVGVRMIHYAGHGRHGLEVIAAFRPDVVFTDYEMPVMNGLDFVKAVRALPGDPRYTPIIMITGHSDMARLSVARDRGVTEFVTKPVSARTVLERLNYVILHPRPFVDAPGYFGPDRRRRREAAYAGPFRRATDPGAMEI